MFSEKRKFKNKKGRTLSAIYEGEDKNAPVVVLCHGYLSSKDSEKTANLSQKLVAKGISVYRFDFLGCGESEGAPGDLTPEEGADDLQSAVKDLGRDKIALYGSSFGGFIALGYAIKHTVLALGLKAPVSDYPAVIAREGNKAEYRSTGFVHQAKNIDIYKNAGKIKAPTLIVHGSEDDVVPIEQSEKLMEKLGGKKRLSIIDGADHGITAPYMEDAMTQMAEFFAGELL